MKTNKHPCSSRLRDLFDISARLKPSPRRPDFSVGPSPSVEYGEEAADTRLTMVNPEPARGIARSVGSLAPDTGRYRHSACTTPEIFSKGDILVLCANPSCPNKGANWALQDELT